MSVCAKRDPQAKGGWVGATNEDFLIPSNIYKHAVADHRIDGQMIEKYRIQLKNSTWTKWYYPGCNDVERVHEMDPKESVDKSIWNEASFKAGRRRWTQFSDHTHEVCFFSRNDFSNPICEWKEPQGEAWVTGVGKDFLKPESVYRHNSADALLYDTRIVKYRIRYANRQITEWYHAGIDDHMVKRRQRNRDPDLWNKDTRLAGRRHWTMFATHPHEVCHLPRDRKERPPTVVKKDNAKLTQMSSLMQPLNITQFWGRHHQHPSLLPAEEGPGEWEVFFVLILCFAIVLRCWHICCNICGQDDVSVKTTKPESKTEWSTLRRRHDGVQVALRHKD